MKALSRQEMGQSHLQIVKNKIIFARTYVCRLLGPPQTSQYNLCHYNNSHFYLQINVTLDKEDNEV